MGLATFVATPAISDVSRRSSGDTVSPANASAGIYGFNATEFGYITAVKRNVTSGFDDAIAPIQANAQSGIGQAQAASQLSAPEANTTSQQLEDAFSSAEQWISDYAAGSDGNAQTFAADVNRVIQRFQAQCDAIDQTHQMPQPV